jgi:hypothetical protein
LLACLVIPWYSDSRREIQKQNSQHTYILLLPDLSESIMMMMATSTVKESRRHGLLLLVLLLVQTTTPDWFSTTTAKQRWSSGVGVLVVHAQQQPSCSQDRLLVGNTRGGSEIVALSLLGGGETMTDVLVAEPFITTGLVAPDQILWRDGYYYISTGDTVDNSAIVRYTADGQQDLSWKASGGGLKRPYGFDFYDEMDLLYVSSFMTDQILIYNATTGEYLDVFAQGDATEEGLCNGPNEMDIYDGKLYMTTQGSYIDEEGNLQYAFASQVVVYDLMTGVGSVFIPQPDPDPNGLGFISMLGIKIVCGDDSLLDDDCTVITTDFAGGLRIYTFSDPTQLLDAQSTTYVEGAATGSFALGPDGTIYIPGFASDDSGVVMSFIPELDSMEFFNETSFDVVYGPDGLLARPIGIFYDECDMSMTMTPIGVPTSAPSMGMDAGPVEAPSSPPTTAATDTTPAPSMASRSGKFHHLPSLGWSVGVAIVVLVGSVFGYY